MLTPLKITADGRWFIDGVELAFHPTAQRAAARVIGKALKVNRPFEVTLPSGDMKKGEAGDFLFFGDNGDVLAVKNEADIVWL